jgi:uncharacterized protein (TIGR02646 family)
MKHIDKGPEPTELTEWNLALAGTPAEWDDLLPEVARALKKALLAEQGHICCYCGRRLLPGDYHIEHQVPRRGATGDASLTFVYRNLLASCQANLGRKDPRHCGTAKGDWYDATLLVSPLDPGCEGRFVYDLDGKVRGADPADEGAKETIAHLDLDGARLRGLRRGVIEALFEGLDHDLDVEERRVLLADYHARDAEGRFGSFCFVLAAALRFLYGDA